MSDKYFHLMETDLISIIEDITDLINHNNIQCVNMYGDLIGHQYSDKTINELHNALRRIQESSIYIKNIDYLVNEECTEDQFHAFIKSDFVDLQQSCVLTQDMVATISPMQELRTVFIHFFLGLKRVFIKCFN